MPRLLRFIIISLLVTIIVALGINYSVTAYGIHEAQEHVKDILLSNRGFHQYIQRVMHPAFFKAVKEGQIDQNYYNPALLSSTYIVRTQHQFFNEIREVEGVHPVYYKLAANNPRNPVNKADDREAELIRLFNSNHQLKENEEIVDVDGHKFIYYAVPFLENQERCMRCHGNPEDAPPGLRALYPEDGGFNEQVGEIRAVESIRMPVDEHINTAYVVTGATSSGIFVLLMLGFVSAGLRKRVKDRTEDLVAEINIRKKTEDNYREVVEGTSDLITKVDATGKLTYVNSMGEQIFGYSQSELIGKLAFDFIHPEDKEETLALFNEWIKNKETTKSFENRQINQRTGEVFHMLWTANAHYDEDGNLTQLTGIARNISERVIAEAKHIENEKRMRAIIDHAPFGAHLYMLNSDNQLIFVGANQTADKILQIDNSQLIGKTIEEAFPTLIDTEVPQIYKQVAATGKPYSVEQVEYENQGIKGAFDIHAFQTDSNYMAAFFADITERKRFEATLIESESQKQQLLDSTAEGIYGVNTKGVCTFANQSCIQMLGYSEEELLGVDMHSLIHHTLPDGTNYPTEDCKIYKALQVKKGLSSDQEVFWRKDSSSFPVEYWSHPIIKDDAVQGAVIAFIDITARREAENSIRKSLNEKEVLLKEVHHRVKNNMAVISALLTMQSAYVKEEKYLAMFEECKSRIISMALVHEQLYKTKDFSSIDVEHYIKPLADNIRSTFARGRSSEIRTDILSTKIDIDELIPIGLIINEIMTNSYKHGYKNKDSITIDISLRKHSETKLALSISDDGKGLPDDFDVNASDKGLGLKLVNALTLQLDGELTVERQPTKFTIIFPENIEHARHLPDNGKDTDS